MGFGDEVEALDFGDKRGIIDLYKLLKEKIQALIAKLRTLPGMTEEALKKIQAKIDEFIKSGKIQAIAQYIVDLVDKYFPQSDETLMEISLQDFKCSDALKAILSEEFCKNIEDMAAKLQLTYDEVMAIVNNVKDVVSDAKKMYEDIKKYMSELSCSKILGADKCAKIEKIADLLSINFDKVALKLKEFYNNGVTSVKELYAKIANWVKGIFGDEVEALDFGDKRGIIDLYKLVKEKVQALLAKLRTLPGMTDEALKKIQAKIDEFIKSGKIQAIAQYIVDLVDKYFPQSDAPPALMEIDLPSKCEDILSTEQCAKIAQIAQILKLKSEEVMAAIQKGIAEGITDAKELYAQAVVYLSGTSCEKVLEADRCNKIKDLANKMQLKAEDIAAAVQKAVESGITNAKDLYAKIVLYMSELTREKVLGQTQCDYLRNLADVISVKYDEVVLKLKEYIEKGVTSATELYKKLVAYIKDKIFGDDSEVTLMEKRGLSD